MTMVLALSYSARWEITDAVRNIAERVAEGTLQPEDIDEQTIGHSKRSSCPTPNSSSEPAVNSD